MPWSSDVTNHTINVMTLVINKNSFIRKSCMSVVIMFMRRRVAIQQVPRDVVVKVAKAMLVVRIAILMTAMRK